MNALKSVAAFLISGTGRRLLVFVIGFLTVALNKKLGLELDAGAIVADIALVIGYLVQSAVKEGVVAGADAKVAAVEAAVAKPSPS